MLATTARFARDYHGQTTLHPLGLAAVFSLGLAMLLVPRRYAVWPMIIMACFVAPAQRLVLMDFDFNLLRLMVLFGAVRVVLRNEVAGFRWQVIDWAVFGWLLVGAAAYIALRGDMSAVSNRLGWMYDGLGMYFLFRFLVRDWDDVWSICRCFSYVSIPVAIAFLVEWTTTRNAFSVLGGVPEVTAVRDGRLRCQGAFAHPILAGCFWAAALPLIAAQWWRPDARSKTLAVIGSFCSMLIVLLCSSSTPASAVILAGFAAALYFVRHWMNWIQICTVIALICLHFLMNTPVWHLLARLDIVGGSTGWHRFHLIDETISNFGEWALLGTLSTAHWGRQLFDVTNQYVLEGVRGGVAALALFVLVIWLAFRYVGRLWRRAESGPHRILSWALGVSLFVHATSFIAVSYFGQITMMMFLAFALPPSLLACRRPVKQPALVRRPAVIEPARGFA